MLNCLHVYVKRCVSERGSTIPVVNVANVETPQWRTVTHKH